MTGAAFGRDLSEHADRSALARSPFPRPIPIGVYLVERTGRVWPDEAAAFVVAAPNMRDAQTMIAEADEHDPVGTPGDEGREVWLDTAKTRVTLLGPATIGAGPRLILRDFRAAW